MPYLPTNITRILVTLSLFAIVPTVSPAGSSASATVLNVKDFGAVGDGKNIDSHAIQPAWGWSLQHIDGLLLENINMTLMNPDERPMTYKKDVKNLNDKH